MTISEKLWISKMNYRKGTKWFGLLVYLFFWRGKFQVTVHLWFFMIVRKIPGYSTPPIFMINHFRIFWRILANIYLFKVNIGNTRKRFKKCSKLIIKTPERRHSRHSGVFIVSFEHVSSFFYCFYFWPWTSKS